MLMDSDRRAFLESRFNLLLRLAATCDGSDAVVAALCALPSIKRDVGDVVSVSEFGISTRCNCHDVVLFTQQLPRHLFNLRQLLNKFFVSSVQIFVEPRFR